MVFIKLYLNIIFLGLIVILSLALRLYGLNWDQGHHLHPDERYLTMVSTDIAWPNSLREYFDPHRSPLSPYNTTVGRAYLYGTFPLFWNKFWAIKWGFDNYNDLAILGRLWSVIFDTGSVIMVFLLAKYLYDHIFDESVPGGFGTKIALLAALFYALTVTAIQHAHFFTMESFLVFFTILTIYFAVRIMHEGKWQWFALAGMAWGLALASKISAVFLLGVIGLAILIDQKSKSLLCFGVALCTFIAYLTFRFFQPYAFANADWFNLTPNPYFLSALKEQQAAINGEFLYPPAYQWLLSKPFISPLINLMVWGLGVPLGVLGILGVLYMIYETIKKRTTLHLLLIAYTLFTFFYVGSRFVNSIRYLITIVPFLAIAAAYFLVKVKTRGTTRGVSVVLLATFAYTLSFLSIYSRPTTRVLASQWIYENVSKDAIIANEEWDDPLPLNLPGYQSTDYFHANQQNSFHLQVYSPDNAEKLARLWLSLNRADYLILSSARASGSIGRLPERFPVMTRYYQLLEDGRLGFEKAVEITSFPGIGRIVLNDQSAEETFWVYDHPVVRIYRKQWELNQQEFRNLFIDLQL